MAQELRAGRLRALILEPGEKPHADVIAAMRAQELCALVFQGAVGLKAVQGALAALDHAAMPKQEVDNGMICAGLPLRLAQCSFEEYLDTARRFRSLSGPPEGPGLEASLIDVLDSGIRTHDVGVLRDPHGELYAPGCIVQMGEGHGIPVHMDQIFFHMPSLYAETVRNLGLDYILNTVVPLALPEAGGAIEMYDVRWSDLPGENLLREALSLGNGLPPETPSIPLPFAVGDVMVLDAMLTGHIVYPVRGNRRRVTYTGHLGVRGSQGFCFV